MRLADASHRAVSWCTATVVVLGLSFGTMAQAQSPEPDVIKQVKLTEMQIKGFISSQPAMAKISEKMQGATSDKPDPAVQAELETIAKANGFKDFAEFDDVAANISMVMAGIDPQSGNYTDPIASIKKEIGDVTADTSIAEKDKKQMLDELNEALKTTQPVQFPENIDLVKKNRAELDKVLQ